MKMIRKLLPTFVILSFLVTSCISISAQTVEPPTTPTFVTSTLRPTHPALLPSFTPTNPAGTATLEVTAPPNCKNQAVLMEDVTIPDGTQVNAGTTFTKTWKFKNTGTCPWTNYLLAFASGDKMNAPDTAPIPQTLPGATVNVSVDLVAPSADGTYTGYFTLQSADGQQVSIGIEKTFWVQIVVGIGGGTSSTLAPTSGASSSGGASSHNGDNCQYSANAGYVNQLLSLINSQRSSAKVAALRLNSQLSAAAQAHSVDQACNSFLGHTGSDGSSIGQRISAAGYSASYYEEIIAVGSPQDAISQWNNDAVHRDAMLDPKVTEVGIGYAFSSNSVYGGHFTVDLANP